MEKVEPQQKNLGLGHFQGPSDVRAVYRGREDPLVRNLVLCMCGANELPDREPSSLPPPPGTYGCRLNVCCLSTLLLSELPIYSLRGVGGGTSGNGGCESPQCCVPRLPVALLMMDDSLGCNICCDGLQRSMKIHKAVLGCISQDSLSLFVCVSVCVFSFCSPISPLSDCIELCHFDNLLSSVCSVLPCVCQREIAICPLMHGLLANNPSLCP